MATNICDTLGLARENVILEHSCAVCARLNVAELRERLAEIDRLGRGAAIVNRQCRAIRSRIEIRTATTNWASPFTEDWSLMLTLWIRRLHLALHRP